MLNKVEFSDLYKFLTSVGLIIIASAFLIPWLFMKQEIGLLISESEYNELFESSKNLTDNRIRLGLLITKAIPYISGTLFVLGIAISGIGLWNWKKKQATVDETDRLKLTELKAKIKELDSSEIDKKAEEEVKKEISLSSKLNEDEVETEIKISNKEKLNIEKLKSNLIDMENLFFNKMIEYNSFVYQPKSNVKIDGKFELDIMLESLDSSQYPDILIEVKYIQNKLKFSFIQDAWKQLMLVYSYLSKSGKKLNTILIVVYKQDIAEQDEINRFLSAVNKYFARFNGNYFKFLVMNDREAEGFDIKKILK